MDFYTVSASIIISNILLSKLFVKIGSKVPCQKLTYIGQIADDEIYWYDMGGSFIPWRRNVNYLFSEPYSIVPILEQYTPSPLHLKRVVHYKIGPLIDFRISHITLRIFYLSNDCWLLETYNRSNRLLKLI